MGRKVFEASEYPIALHERSERDKANIEIQFCPTDHMIGDYMMKPLHSKKFEKLPQVIMNFPCTTQLLMATCIED
jgi:hypothetical protein